MARPRLVSLPAWVRSGGDSEHEHGMATASYGHDDNPDVLSLDPSCAWYLYAIDLVVIRYKIDGVLAGSGC